jgi:hypothetical protein
MSNLQHVTETYSHDNHTWCFNTTGHWVGGRVDAPNLSTGFHGLLKQWWEYYAPGQQKVLLVAEPAAVKKQLETLNPLWKIDTIDMYPELHSNETIKPTIIGDICSRQNPLHEKYTLIINQATLEHVYNPFQAMFNFCEALDENGILITHTCPPGHPYHRYPADYIRFMKDWWYDLPKYIEKIQLLELYMYNNMHVFTCYKKIK